MSDVTITHNPDASRYEAHLAPEDGAGTGELVGFAEYQLRDGLILFTHTEVHREGLGIGGKIVRFALDDVRATGERRVVPLCPFVAAWIEKHPDHADLVADRD